MRQPSPVEGELLGPQGSLSGSAFRLQDDKDLVPEFVNSEGLTCLVSVGAEADQNYQNYILRGESDRAAELAQGAARPGRKGSASLRAPGIPRPAFYLTASHRGRSRCSWGGRILAKLGKGVRSPWERGGLALWFSSSNVSRLPPGGELNEQPATRGGGWKEPQSSGEGPLLFLRKAAGSLQLSMFPGRVPSSCSPTHPLLGAVTKQEEAR